MYPVGLSWDGKQSGSKTAAGTGGREACGIPSGCCGDSFNLSIPHCPQQLLEMGGGGLKMPRAETHKSRLGWNKKEDEMLWGKEDDRDYFSFINMEYRKGLHVTVLILVNHSSLGGRCAAAQRQLPVAPCLPLDAVIRFALLCVLKNGSEYSYPVANS